MINSCRLNRPYATVSFHSASVLARFLYVILTAILVLCRQICTLKMLTCPPHWGSLYMGLYEIHHTKKYPEYKKNIKTVSVKSLLTPHFYPLKANRHWRSPPFWINFEIVAIPAPATTGRHKSGTKVSRRSCTSIKLARDPGLLNPLRDCHDTHQAATIWWHKRGEKVSRRRSTEDTLGTCTGARCKNLASADGSDGG